MPNVDSQIEEWLVKVLPRKCDLVKFLDDDGKWSFVYLTKQAVYYQPDDVINNQTSDAFHCTKSAYDNRELLFQFTGFLNHDAINTVICEIFEIVIPGGLKFEYEKQKN